MSKWVENERNYFKTASRKNRENIWNRYRHGSLALKLTYLISLITLRSCEKPQLDLEKFDSVRVAASELEQRLPHLDALILNAGFSFLRKFHWYGIKRNFCFFLFKVSWERLLNSVMDLSFTKKLIIFHIFFWPISCSNYWKLLRHALEWYLSRGKKNKKINLKGFTLKIQCRSYVCKWKFRLLEKVWIERCISFR